MAETQSGGGKWLFFIVGGLVVVVAVLAYIYFEGSPSGSDVNINVGVTEGSGGDSGGGDSAGGDSGGGEGSSQ